MHAWVLAAAAVIGLATGAEAALFGPGDNIRFEVSTPQRPDLYGASPSEGAFTDVYNIIFNRDEPAVGRFSATLTEVVGISNVGIEVILPFTLGGGPAIDLDPDPLVFLLGGGFLAGSFAFPDTVYQLKIGGTAAPGAFYTGTGFAWPTPLPEALPLLGAALAGLAAVGLRRPIHPVQA